MLATGWAHALGPVYILGPIYIVCCVGNQFGIFHIFCHQQSDYLEKRLFSVFSLFLAFYQAVRTSES